MGDPFISHFQREYEYDLFEFLVPVTTCNVYPRVIQSNVAAVSPGLSNLPVSVFLKLDGLLHLLRGSGLDPHYAFNSKLYDGVPSGKQLANRQGCEFVGDEIVCCLISDKEVPGDCTTSEWPALNYRDILQTHAITITRGDEAHRVLSSYHEAELRIIVPSTSVIGAQL